MDTLGICTSRHVRTVSLVVSAVDDLTGRVITGSNVRVWIEGAKPPVKKAEGWHVFLNLPVGEHTVWAEGGFYHRSSTVCTVTGEELPNIKLRLTPNRSAPLPPGTALIEGRGIPGETLLLRPNERSLAYKLLSDGKEGDTALGIFHPEGMDIEGKRFCICAPDGGEEIIRVYRSAGRAAMEYRLSAPLKRAYPKIGTLVYPFSECIVGAAGTFFLPVGQLPGKPCTCILRRETEGDGGGTLTVSAGSRVTQDCL